MVEGDTTLLEKLLSERETYVKLTNGARLAKFYPKLLFVDKINSNNVRKVIENGQIVIIRDGVRYNVLGTQL